MINLETMTDEELKDFFKTVENDAFCSKYFTDFKHCLSWLFRIKAEMEKRGL